MVLGLLILRILGIVYLFMGIALVCDDFFTAFSRNVWRLYGGAKGLVMWY